VRDGRSRFLPADPGVHGYEFLDRVIRTDPGAQVIVMTGQYTPESALEAIRRGAIDFLPKPIDRNRLKHTMDESAALYDQRRRVRSLGDQLLKDLEFHGIVGKSPAMLDVLDFARKVARHDTHGVVKNGGRAARLLDSVAGGAVLACAVPRELLNPWVVRTLLNFSLARLKLAKAA
jgi:YesN/AraC family two-component response regulator